MYHIEKITALQQLLPYEAQWRAFLEQEDNQNPFIEWFWITTWWSCYEQQVTAEIYLIWQQEVLVAIAPFQVEHMKKHKKYQFLAAGEATYMDIMALEGHHYAVVNELFPQLLAGDTPVVLALQGIPELSPTKLALLHYSYRVNAPFYYDTDIAAFVDIEKINIGNHIKKRNRKFNITRGENKLRQTGCYTFKEIPPHEIAQVFAIYNQRWRKKINTGHFGKPQTAEFYYKIAAQSQEQGRGIYQGVYVDNVLLGFVFNYICRDKIVGYACGFEESFSKFSIGHLLDKNVLHYAQEQGQQIVDFSIGYEPAKFSWTTEASLLHNFFIGNKQAARIVQRVQLKQQLITTAKSSYAIVQFKRNTLGQLRHYMKNPLQLLKLIPQPIKLSVDHIYQRDFSKQLRVQPPELASLETVLTVLTKEQVAFYSYFGYVFKQSKSGELYAINEKQGYLPTWYTKWKLPINAQFIVPLQNSAEDLALLTRNNLQVAIPSYKRATQQRLQHQNFKCVAKIISCRIFSKTYSKEIIMKENFQPELNKELR